MDSHHGFIVQNPSPFQPKPGLLDSGYKHKFPMLHPYSQPDNRMSPQDSRDSQSDSLMCQLDSRNSQSERRIDPHDSRDSQSVPRMRQIDGRNDLPDSKTNPYRSEESQVDFQAKSPNDNFQRNSVDKSQHEERDVEVRTNLFESFKSDSFDPGSRERGDDIRRQSDDNDKKSQNSISVKEQQSDSRRKQKWNYEKMPDFGKEEKSEAGKSSVNKSNVVKGVGNLTLVKEKGKKSVSSDNGLVTDNIKVEKHKVDVMAVNDVDTNDMDETEIVDLGHKAETVALETNQRRVGLEHLEEGNRELKKHCGGNIKFTPDNFNMSKVTLISEQKFLYQGRAYRLPYPTQAELTCQVCDKVVRNIKELMEHAFSHTKLFQCWRCEDTYKSYTERDVFRSHLKSCSAIPQGFKEKIIRSLSHRPIASSKVMPQHVIEDGVGAALKKNTRQSGNSANNEIKANTESYGQGTVGRSGNDELEPTKLSHIPVWLPKENLFSCRKCCKKFKLRIHLKKHFCDENRNVGINSSKTIDAPCSSRRMNVQNSSDKIDVSHSGNVEDAKVILGESLKRKSDPCKEVMEAGIAEKRTKLDKDEDEVSGTNKKYPYKELKEMAIGKTTCPICFRICKNRCTLLLHIVSHTDEEPFQCSLCEFRSKVVLTVHKHQAGKHDGQGYVKELGNQARERLSDGKKKVSGQYSYKELLALVEHTENVCPVCTYTSPQKSNMQRHIVVHTNERPFKCRKCSKGYPFRENLRRHFRICSIGTKVAMKSGFGRYKPSGTDNKTGIKSKKSNISKEDKERNNRSRRYHSKNRPSELDAYFDVKDGVYYCTKCKKAFRHRRYVVDHYNKVHLKEAKLMCKTCKRRFFSTEDFDKHYQEMLKEHQTMHVVMKLVPKVKDLKTKSSPDVQKTKITSEITDNKSQRIEKAGQAASRLHIAELKTNESKSDDQDMSADGYLKTREEVKVEVEQAITISKEERIAFIRCNICAKKFSGKRMLEIHLVEEHSNMNTHSCPICGKKFSFIDCLENHSRYNHFT
ncbi:zinc finger protein 91-like [Mya arenaria]|uniref:zinc finger protein 91-like n=1 Tax=Mya arenaria TaxID=6604 RepID=UPI0022E4EE7E|nr:zinc finger protein 91-like [Mya arenaria]